MENLGYKLLVDKSIKRKVTILRELKKNSRTLKELSIECNATEPTILLDIAELNTGLPSEDGIKELRKNFFSLDTASTFIVTDYIKILMRESPLFIIIETIFEGQEQTIEEIADDLFLSESSIRKYLLVLERVLEEFHLSLSFKPVTILGDEANIRYFFFQYFRYGHETSTIIQKNRENAEATYAFLDALAFNYGVVLHVDYHRILSWLYILEKRIMLEKNVTLGQEVIDRHVNTDGFKRFHKSFDQFFSDNLILRNLSLEEKIYAYVVRLSTIIYDSNGIFFLSDYEGYMNNYKIYNTNFFIDQNLYPTLYLEMQVRNQCFLANLFFLTEITPLFQISSTELRIQVSENFPSIYNSWVKIFKQSGNWMYPEDVAVNLTMLSSIQLHLNMYKYKKVLFSLTGEPTSLTYYKTLAYKFVPKEADVYFFSNRPITTSLTKTLEIDIIICNFELAEPIDGVDIIRLSDVPSKGEWEQLLLKLYDM